MKSKKYPHLIEQLGKYSTDRYLIQSEKDLDKVSLEILQKYKESGYLFLGKNPDQSLGDYLKQ